MKVLYISHERRAAERAAAAMRGMSPPVSLAWAGRPGSAVPWIQSHPGAAAIILEAEVQGESCLPVVARLRALSRRVAIVVIGPAGFGAAHEAGADACAVAGPSLDAELPRVLAEALRRHSAAPAAEADGMTAARAGAAEGHHADPAGAGGSASGAGHQRDAALERVCTGLQQRLLELEAALQSAEDRRAADLAAASDQLARRDAEHRNALAQADESRETLTRKLAAATAALEDVRQARKRDAEAAAARRARREADVAAALEEAAAARSVLERRLGEGETALEESRRRAAEDLRAAAEERFVLDRRLEEERSARASVEEALARAEAARQEADSRHRAELAAATARLAELHAQYEASLKEHAAARTAFERRLADTSAALDSSRRERDADAAAASEVLASREAAFDAALAESAAREADLAHGLRHLSDLHAAVERELAAARGAASLSRRRLLAAVQAHRGRARERQVWLERDRAAARHAIRERDEELRRIRQERDGFERDLQSSREDADRLRRTLAEERDVHEGVRSTYESELRRVSAEGEQARHALEQVQAAFATLERVAREHAVERARLETVVADRDAALSAASAQHLAATQASNAALAAAREALREARAARDGEIARLQQELAGLRDGIDAATQEAAGLRTALERSRRDNRRQFERAPYGLCRCTPDGVITDVNHSLVRLLGYRKADDLRHGHFASAVFECSSDLRWLIEQAAASGRTETIEAAWKTRDGRRLAVRLLAQAAPDASVEIAVEDITGLRALQRRLDEARRLEAVGRLASEVAATCDALLGDVARGGAQWLEAIDADPAVRRQGELLLADVSRAAGFLRQFADYGSRQTSALEPVDLPRVLRDLEPVLKRIAGDGIDLVLSRTTAPLEVDVDAERLERILVNLAGYARGRMPAGGRIRIDLSTVTLGQRFLARYPGVRPGAHALVTVTEERHAPVPAGLTGFAAAPNAGAADAGHTGPGVDVGVLLELVGGCGGHLWMDARSSGSMTLKIHLPKRAPVDARDTVRAADPDAVPQPRTPADLARASSAVRVAG